MPLLLTEADVKSILTMPLALEAVETSFQRLAEGSALLQYRQRLHVPGKGVLNHMAAADLATGYMGLKIYSISRDGARFLVTLYSADSGDLVALIEADYLGQVRTGAASGLATRLMARQDARVAAMIGTGLQARTQLEAIVAVRKLDSIRACGRDPGRRETFAREMSARLGVPVMPVSSVEEAVRGAQILTTCTSSKVAVLEGRWIEPGTHINAVGVNQAQKRELDTETILRCDVVAADSREQSKIESGDLIHAFAGDLARWDSVREFADIVAGKIAGRTTPAEITLFKSNGVATEDIVVAGRIYEIARNRGMGRLVPMWEDKARTLAERGV
ncbi:MAG: ornithine cyclodeaminase family protein [Candidatus Acidiferrales bacterium]|jgi:ornithine cyclodeaminase/alanine dehydrogenase-like protein (mu-crystallin family)